MRQISDAKTMGSFVGAAAVMMMQSKPWPFVKFSQALKRLESLRFRAFITLISLARVISLSDRSMPKTSQPLAFNNCPVIWPKSPNPITHTFSPNLGSACRTPCKAIAPSVVKAASSKETLSGIFTTRF